MLSKSECRSIHCRTIGCLLAFIMLVTAQPVSAYYCATTGRFLQRDPLGIDPAGGRRNGFAVSRQYTDGANLYEYVESKAIKKTDPMGLEQCDSDEDSKSDFDKWWEEYTKDKAGLTSCNPATPLGQDPVRTWINPILHPDVSKCVKEHENRHKKQIRKACGRYQKCYHNAGPESGWTKEDCREAYYDKWHTPNTRYRECVASKTEFRCYSRLEREHRCDSNSEWYEKWKEMAKEEMNKKCTGKPKSTKIPFDENGKPL